jgi:hypothetical protein
LLLVAIDNNPMSCQKFDGLGGVVFNSDVVSKSVLVIFRFRLSLQELGNNGHINAGLFISGAIVSGF